MREGEGEEELEEGGRVENKRCYIIKRRELKEKRDFSWWDPKQEKKCSSSSSLPLTSSLKWVYAVCVLFRRTGERRPVALEGGGRVTLSSWR